MSATIFGLFVLTSLFSLGLTQQRRVSIYYETLCPDSIIFITKQFWPIYKKIGSHILVDLIPYGKSSERENLGKWKFNCHHGPNECYANAYHACAVGIFSKEQSAEFVYCSMKSNDPSSEENLRKCASRAGLSWKSLQICYESGQADKFLIQNAERTRAVQPKITFIPTVILDNKYDESNQERALADFGNLMCDVLDIKPERCQQYNYL